MASNSDEVRQAAIQELARRELAKRQNVNTTPFPIQSPDNSLNRNRAAQFGGLPPPTVFNEEEKALANEGVDIKTGAPVGRFASGFAQNEAQQANYLKKKLSEFYKTDVTVQQGPMGLEFINPETGRRTLVDEATGTLRDLQDMAGPAIPAAAATAGAIGGGMIGMPTVGTGAGGAAGEGVRRFIGDQMGVRDESPGEAVSGSLGVGVTEAAFGKAADLGVAGLKKARDFIRPRPLSVEGAENALSAMQADQAIADEISQRTGQRFQPFTGQMSGDPTLLGGQAAARNSSVTGPAVRQQEIGNETALETFFNELNPSRSAPNTATGRSIQNEARDQTRPRVEAAKDSLDANIAKLEELTAAIPSATDSTIVKNLSKEAAEGRRLIAEAEDQAWNDTRSMMNVGKDALSDVKIPISDADTLRSLKAEAKAAIDPATASGKRALLPEGLQGNEVDLNQLQVYLSELKRRRRLQSRGEVATDPQGGDIKRVINELTVQRNRYLAKENPELLAQLEEAEALTRKRAELFDNGLVGQLLRKEGGEWQLRDSELIGRTIGSGDKEAIEHLVAALSRHPAGLPTLERSFMQFYRNEVVQDGLPNAVLHKRFMKNHGEAIDVLFPNNQHIRQFGEFEKVVSHQIKRFENFEKAVDKSFRGRLQNISPENVAEKIFSDKFSIKDVKNIVGLAEGAGVKEQYKNAVTDQVRRRFMSETSGLNLNSMSKFVDQNSDRLAIAVSPEYVRDMKKLLAGLRTTRTSASGIQTTRNPTLIGSMAEGLARITVARPLSPSGVGLTRLLRFRDKAAQRMMAAAIQDPKALRAIVAQKDSDLRDRAVVRIMAVLGGSGLAIDKFEGE